MLLDQKPVLKVIKKLIKWIFQTLMKLLEKLLLDIKEGADIVMVKPGMPYLDIIK